MNTLKTRSTASAAMAGAVLAALLASMPASAADPLPDDIIGYVKTVSNEATVTTPEGSRVPAAPGMPVRRAGAIATGKNGSLGVTLRDNTIVSIGPDSTVAFGDYRFEPAKGDYRFEAAIGRGSVYIISGLIEKLKPESVVITTPSGAIGVRGARLLARVDDPDGDSQADARSVALPNDAAHDVAAVVAQQGRSR